jgi:hypothetical protein
LKIISENEKASTRRPLHQSPVEIPNPSLIHRMILYIDTITEPRPLVAKTEPMVGLEKLVEAIFNSHQGLNPPVRNTAPHLIIDARPLTNAIAQTAMGAGTENESNYPGSKLVFLGIENIHVVRDSFNKLYDGTDFSFNLACVSFEGGDLSKSALDRSGWLKHLKTILDGAALITNSVDEKNAHVLIHCRYVLNF